MLKRSIAEGGNFYTVETVDRWTRPLVNFEYVYIQIWQDPKYYKYERKVLNIQTVLLIINLKVFGDIGGANEIVSVMLFILIGWYNKKMLRYYFYIYLYLSSYTPHSICKWSLHNIGSFDSETDMFGTKCCRTSVYKYTG